MKKIVILVILIAIVMGGQLKVGPKQVAEFVQGFLNGALGEEIEDVKE